MKEKSYTPQPGSKVALAATAMLDGPVPTEGLRKVMDCAPKNIHTLLSVALMHGYMVRVKDETGLIHYALTSEPLDDRFTLDHDTGKSEQPDKAKSNWNQGAFPSNPFPVSNNGAGPAPAKTAKTAVKNSIAAVRHVVADLQPGRDNQAAVSFVREITSQQPASAEFLAGFFSNGELRLSVGEQQLTLCADHQRQLKSFLNQIKEPA